MTATKTLREIVVEAEAAGIQMERTYATIQEAEASFRLYQEPGRAGALRYRHADGPLVAWPDDRGHGWTRRRLLDAECARLGFDMT